MNKKLLITLISTITITFSSLSFSETEKECSRSETIVELGMNDGMQKEEIKKRETLKKLVVEWEITKGEKDKDVLMAKSKIEELDESISEKKLNHWKIKTKLLNCHGK